MGEVVPQVWGEALVARGHGVVGSAHQAHDSALVDPQGSPAGPMRPAGSIPASAQLVIGIFLARALAVFGARTVSTPFDIEALT